MMNANVELLVATGLAQTKSIPAEQALFCLGDRCENFVVVREGIVRVELLSKVGQQMLLYRIEAGQSCVMTTSCLFGNSQYFAQAISETPTEIVLLPKSVFDEQITTSPQFREFVFSDFHERLTGLMNRTAELATSTIDQRLAATLLAQADYSNSELTIELTHQQLAIDIGSAREVVSRRLAAFEGNGAISKNRGQIKILDAEKLQALLPS